jgi:hypothetical protein
VPDPHPEAREPDWLEPWYLVTEFGEARAQAMGDTLEGELHKELCPAHVLYGKRVRLIARRADTDDALFALDDSRVAEVHLTWRGSVEPDPRWPDTAIFASLEDWRERSMRPLHAWLNTLGGSRS